MDFLRRLASRFTIRGRALAQIDGGMACAKNREPENAIKKYTDVIASLLTPEDVKAMAVFNRSLVYATIDKETNAIEDLNTILSMSGATSAIKTSAREKLVRMQRKRTREQTS